MKATPNPCILKILREEGYGAVINLDDISHIAYLERHVGIPEMLSFRYNPGSLRVDGNAIIGNPVEAKYGLTREQIFEAYRLVKGKGVRRFGLHTMVVSNELNPASFIETARMMLDLAVEIYRKLGIQIEFVNLGGGVGIPYRPEEEPVARSPARTVTWSPGYCTRRRPTRITWGWTPAWPT